MGLCGKVPCTIAPYGQIKGQQTCKPSGRIRPIVFMLTSEFILQTYSGGHTQMLLLNCLDSNSESGCL